MESRVAALLSEVPDKSNVAVVTMVGSCCPVTLAHVQAFIEARRLLLGESERPEKLEEFSEVLGFLALNGDGHVRQKLAAKGEPFIKKQERAHLIDIATTDYPWLNYVEKGFDLTRFVKSFCPGAKVIYFHLNGADDVVRFRKWNMRSKTNRHITMGRPGSTRKVLEGMSKIGLDANNGICIVGPELPDISSTAVRKAMHDCNIDELKNMLHPGVIEWCLSFGPYNNAANSSRSSGPYNQAPVDEAAGPSRRWRRGI